MSPMNRFFNNFKAKIKVLKNDIKALYLASKRPDIPLFAKLFTILVVGYALSPIDFIPDFVPILGYLDDLVLIPLGVALAIKMIPPHIIQECRLQAQDVFKDGKPKNWLAGAIIITIWVAIIGLIAIKIFSVK